MSPDDIREEAFILLGRVMTRSDPSRLEAWAGLSLTMTQLRVLFMVRNDEGVSAGALAEALGVTPPTFTRIMDRLVSGGLIHRRADAKDRRIVCHYLTDDGRLAVQELERTGRARLDAILDRLSPHQLERIVLALRDLNQATESLDAESTVRAEA